MNLLDTSPDRMRAEQLKRPQMVAQRLAAYVPPAVPAFRKSGHA